MALATTASAPLAESALELESILTHGCEAPILFEATNVRRETVWVPMRDGVRLATELYLPPRVPAPIIAARTPYGRAASNTSFIAFAQRGYAIVSQDCRGTGESEPDRWDYSVYEREDSFDFVEWVTLQEWFGGFIGGFGSSYAGTTQWCMAFHPRMSAITPEVAGLGVDTHTARLYMFLNAYSRSIGNGAEVSMPPSDLEREMLEETLANGYFNEPLQKPLSTALVERYPALRSLSIDQAKRWLWDLYRTLVPARRAEIIKLALGVRNVSATHIDALADVFGHHISHDAYALPRARNSELVQSLRAPALLITGWYDWFLYDTLATWDLLVREATHSVKSRSRLLITPSAHNVPGYHEGSEDHPELKRTFRTSDNVALLLRWYEAVQNGETGSWPVVTYYLMGANEWHSASTWPPVEARNLTLHLGSNGALVTDAPPKADPPDKYTYNPNLPTPTVGGSIVSFVYPPGSVDVSHVQSRSDVLTYTTQPLGRSLDVVGPLRLILWASSSAVDTDFAARLSDVFPDGRAIQLQSAMLRTRFRDRHAEPQLLEPNRAYRFEIDLCATANRFGAGHRLRLDIASADFPKFDRNTNRGGDVGPPKVALQTVFHDEEHPSHLILSITGDNPRFVE